MKKTLLAILLMLILAMMAASVAPAFADVRTYYIKTGNGGSANVREGPGKNYNVIGTMKYGSAVGVDEWLGNWAHIVYGSRDDAFIHKDCLSKTKPSSKPSQKTDKSGDADYTSFKAADYTVSVKPTRASGWVNLRWAPSTESRAQAQYYKGETLRVIAEGKKWIQVFDDVNNRCGFMLKEYTTKLAY